MRTRKDCKQLVRGVDFSMAHASKQKKPDSKLLDHAPDFDGNFASLYDRYCEPGTGSNFSYYMEYDANLLDLDDLVQRDKYDDV